MTTTPPAEHPPEDQHPAVERGADLGALTHLLTFEEVDDAIDTLERLLSLRAAERAELPPYEALMRDPYAGRNANIDSAITQLQQIRRFRAIPEDVLEAALAAAGYPLEDDDEDGEQA